MKTTAVLALGFIFFSSGARAASLGIVCSSQIFTNGLQFLKKPLTSVPMHAVRGPGQFEGIYVADRNVSATITTRVGDSTYDVDVRQSSLPGVQIYGLALRTGQMVGFNVRVPIQNQETFFLHCEPPPGSN